MFTANTVGPVLWHLGCLRAYGREDLRGGVMFYDAPVENRL